jgi:hypothetical protein
MDEKSDSELNSAMIQEDPDTDDRFVDAWVANLLSLLQQSIPDETQKHLFKECSAVHYDRIGMEDIVSQYRGDLDGFLKVLEEKWQWRVVYDPETNQITADENKNECVCPIVRLSSSPIPTILCHCSEGFAERMFSAVVGRPVKAQVMQSILRGSSSCVYRIQM